MQVCFDPALMEAAVFLAARQSSTAGDRRLEGELHRRIDGLYALADADEREAAFRREYAELFSSYRLAGPLESLIAEQPLLEERVSRCLVRSVARPQDELAELFVKHIAGQPERTLLIALRPQTLRHPTGLARAFRHELQYIADMLDESFGYEPTTLAIGGSSARTNLILDRIRVLWDTYIDGRLARRGHGDQAIREVRLSQFHKVFRLDHVDDEALSSACIRLWSADDLTFAELLRWAESPERLLKSSTSNERLPVSHP